MFLNLSFEGRIYMSQTGTPTEFLGLGITEPDDTLNVLVDLNGQWQKIDTGVKNVDTKANTNASGISALNTAVQDNTENITNILETNVNQQNSIDTLQSKVATLEQDDTDYGTRITAVEAGVQENSELINDLEVELSGVETSVGTVPSGSTLQGQVDELDTRVTTLENSGSVSALETRVTTLETEVGTVPAGETVQGQITTLNGQVNSGNIPFRFSVDGGGNYGYLKADDSFVPFSSGSPFQLIDTTLYKLGEGRVYSYIVPYLDFDVSDSPNYGKLHDFINNVDYTLPSVHYTYAFGSIILSTTLVTDTYYIANNGTLTPISGSVKGVCYNKTTHTSYYLTRNGNNIQINAVDVEGNVVGLPVDYSLHGTPTTGIKFTDSRIIYGYNGYTYLVAFDINTGTFNESTINYTTSITNPIYFKPGGIPQQVNYTYNENGAGTADFTNIINNVVVDLKPYFVNANSNYYLYL